MKRGVLVLGAILLFGFGPKNETIDKVSSETAINEVVVTKEIEALEQIIESKIKEADIMETLAEGLLKENQNSIKATRLSEKAQMLRMTTLKYKAAIACKTRFLN